MSLLPEQDRTKALLELLYNVSREVATALDLRTVLPWDSDTVEASVNKTGRLVVSHEVLFRSSSFYSPTIRGSIVWSRRGDDDDDDDDG